MNMNGEVVVITGGNTGIGRAISRAMQAEGAKVVINYVAHEEQAYDLAHELNSREPGSAMVCRADITRVSDVRIMFEAVREHFGGVDVLVNNAGINIPASILDLSEEDWDRVLDTNLKGAFLCSREAIPLMLNRGGGVIVNVSSESGMSSISCPPTNPHYAAAKMGLIGLTRIMAVNLAPKIRVNAVAPGWIDTEIHNESGEEGRAALVLSQIPMGRAGNVEEVAQVVLFLSSSQSSYVSGQTIAIGGARVLH